MKKGHLRLVEKSSGIKKNIPENLFTGKEPLDMGEKEERISTGPEIYARLSSMIGEKYTEAEVVVEALEFRKLIFRIRHRIEHLFESRLLAGFCKHDVEDPNSPDDHYYIVRRVWRWKAFPRDMYVFRIFRGFRGAYYREKEFTVQVYDDRILSIVLEEVEIFKGNVGATGYEIS